MTHPLEPDIAPRITLYRRAEQPVRRLFSEHFGRLCEACGTLAQETEGHICCCIGVPCLQHLERSPVLRAMAADDPRAAAVVDLRRKQHRDTFLGPTGCMLDWGRPPPCNACICTPQRNCLLSVLPAARVVAFSKALRTYALIANPALRNLDSLEKAVANLERETAAVAQLIVASQQRFSQAIDRAMAALQQYASQVRAPENDC